MIAFLKERFLISPAGTLLSGAGCIAFAVGYYHWSQEDDLARHGVETRGMVTYKFVPDKDDTGRPYIKYQFRTRAGEVIDLRAQVSRGRYDTFSPGKSVTIFYSSENPTNSRLTTKAHFERSYRRALFFALALIGAAATLAGIYIYRNPRRIY